MPYNAESTLPCLFLKEDLTSQSLCPLQLFILEYDLLCIILFAFLDISITKELNISNIEEDCIKPVEKRQRSFLWATYFCRRYTRLTG